MDCRFEVYRDAASENPVDCPYSVRLCIEGEEPLSGPLDLQVLEDAGPRAILAKLEKGSCESKELLLIGTYLWNALRPDAIRTRLQSIREPYSIRLSIPPDLPVTSHPWEAIFDEATSRYLACDPRRSMTRVAAGDIAIAPDKTESRPIRMLVAIPQGSGLDTAKELAILRNVQAKLGRKRFEVKELDGIVTTELLHKTLRESEWDIFHFIGHSKFNASGGVLVRVNEERDANNTQWVDANQFAEVLSAANLRLCVFNSCESEPSVSNLLSGLGQQVTRIAGVPAVVAMRYQIDDDSAPRFADSFYRELLTSKVHAGRVDLAMQAARHSLYISARPSSIRSFITPVLYVVPGSEQIFAEERLRLYDVVDDGVIVIDPDPVKLPPELVQSIRNRRCVPIVGPGLLAPAVRDDNSSAPTLMHILAKAAVESGYPDNAELKVAESMADLSSVLCSRIFQYYESERERYTLIEYLQHCCASEAPPATLERIVRWNVPGIIYTHIDGMVEEALRRTNRYGNFRIVNIPNESLASTAQPGSDIQALATLFNLRGTLSDAASLVLTDSDHEKLADDLAKARPEVVSLFRGPIGRSVLFIGTSPLDPAIRRLARLYLETGQARLQGPRYFVVPHASAGDKAYWKQFNVKWIEADPTQVVERLDALLREVA